MTPAELNNLPYDQKQNALLAIALGYELRGNYLTINCITSIHGKVTIYFDQWNPSEDKALMWGLVCDLGYSPCYVIGTKGSLFCCEYYNKEYKVLTHTDSYNTREQALIAAYIAADPKGNIDKWRKENE